MLPRQLDLAELRAFMTAEYSRERARRGMLEAEYFNLYGELPPDAVVLESIEWYGENVLIVHQDPNAVRQ